jgi:hypothetical protein
VRGSLGGSLLLQVHALLSRPTGPSRRLYHRPDPPTALYYYHVQYNRRRKRLSLPTTTTRIAYDTAIVWDCACLYWLLPYHLVLVLCFLGCADCLTSIILCIYLLPHTLYLQAGDADGSVSTFAA